MLSISNDLFELFYLLQKLSQELFTKEGKTNLIEGSGKTDNH